MLDSSATYMRCLYNVYGIHTISLKYSYIIMQIVQFSCSVTLLPIEYHTYSWQNHDFFTKLVAHYFMFWINDKNYSW